MNTKVQVEVESKAVGAVAQETVVKHNIAMHGSVMIGSPDELGVKENPKKTGESNEARNARTEKSKGV